MPSSGLFSEITIKFVFFINLFDFFFSLELSPQNKPDLMDNQNVLNFK